MATYKALNFNKLDLPNILEIASHFSLMGTLRITQTNLVYLSVMDEYIHRLYPLMHEFDNKIEEPDYFGLDPIGAHISVIYPEENVIIDVSEINQEYSFEITGVYTANLGLKKYFVLGVESPSIVNLRKKYGLGKKLLFKNFLIDLHITIGTHPIEL